jgi:hypothetical protein
LSPTPAPQYRSRATHQYQKPATETASFRLLGADDCDLKSGADADRMNVIYNITWWVVTVGVAALDRRAWREAPESATCPAMPTDQLPTSDGIRHPAVT